MKKTLLGTSEQSGFNPQPSDDVLVRVKSVSKKFCRDLKRSLWYGMKDLGSELLCRRHDDDIELRKNEFWAIKDVSFELRRGECLGLIGRNGAGKTTLLRMLNGLIRPDKGRIEMRGRVGALIALGTGFNPVLTGRENIYVNAAILGLSKSEIDAKYDEIVEFAELGEFIDTPVQSYSSGMQVRLGFSVATTLESDVLLLDEVLAVGDMRFRMKCYQRIADIVRRSAVVFVSHDLNAIQRICDRTLVLDYGREKFSGTLTEGVEIYKSLNQSKNESKTTISVFTPELCLSEIIVSKTDIKTAERINIIINYNSNSPLKIGCVSATIMNDLGISVAHYRSDALGCEYSIRTGDHSLTIPLGPVNLTTGQYSVSCSLFDESKKTAILIACNFARLKIKGNVSSAVTVELGHNV